MSKDFEQAAAGIPRTDDVRDPDNAVDNPATNGDDVFDPMPEIRKSPSEDLPDENPPDHTP